MGSVYSTRFLLKAGGSATYTVPAGKRAVVKGMTTVNSSAAQRGMSMTIAGFPVFVLYTPAGGCLERSSLHLVANAGENITINLDTDITCQVGGYLLDAV